LAAGNDRDAATVRSEQNPSRQAKEQIMRAITVLRIATLSAMLSVPLGTASIAFAGDDNSLTEAKQQSMVSPYDPDQNRDPVFGITYPWTVPSDE
jgi:hypothetical protein